MIPMSLPRFLCVSLSVLSLAAAVSCGGPGRDVRECLEFAGSNRAELEAVLDHYRSSGERKKFEAASFLIGNMKDAHALVGPSLDLYYSQLDEFYDRDSVDIFALREFNDSLFASRDYFGDLVKEYDARTIGADYLIGHIDAAFELWDSPWARNLDFGGFCEYILPYRFGTEELEDWRGDFLEYYGPAFERLLAEGNPDPRAFCDTLNTLYPETHNYEKYPAGKPTFRPSVLKRICGGSCDDYSALFSSIARTFGLPVAADFTPQWGNHSKGHRWSAVLGGDGETMYYEVGRYLYPEGRKGFTWKLVKVFRRMSYGLLDVTDKYTEVTDVQVGLPGTGRARPRKVSLAVFNDVNWVPLAGTVRKGNRAVFGKMGYPCVYLPVYSEEGRVVPASDPVLVDSSRAVRVLKADTSRLRTVHLTRKFLDRRALQFVDSLRGGRFELADNKDFRNALRLDIPEDITFNYQTLTVDSARSFRYLRYVPRGGSRGNIAEIEVYDRDGDRVHGRIIGNYDSGDRSHAIDRAFDDKPLTYAMCRSTEFQWIGLDLGRPLDVGRICYLSRSDDNFIRDGQEYELCYWDGAWVSLGRRIGSRETQELVYDNVPEGALLLLHNLTEGKEERIFTYENGVQVWW